MILKDMVAVELYGDERATCTQRVLILLEELNLKYTLVSVDLSKNEHKHAEYMSMQPFGKVPVVRYGDTVIFESRAILRFIAKANDDIVDLCGDHNVDVWMEVEGQNYNPPISKIVYEKMFKQEEDPAVVETALVELEKVLDVYDTHLSNKEYIAGDSFTIADITHIPYTYCLLKCGYKDVLKRRENVYNWLKRIMRREAVRRVLENRTDE